MRRNPTKPIIVACAVFLLLVWIAPLHYIIRMGLTVIVLFLMLVALGYVFIDRKFDFGYWMWRIFKMGKRHLIVLFIVAAPLFYNPQPWPSWLWVVKMNSVIILSLIGIILTYRGLKYYFRTQSAAPQISDRTHGTSDWTNEHSAKDYLSK